MPVFQPQFPFHLLSFMPVVSSLTACTSCSGSCVVLPRLLASVYSHSSRFFLDCRYPRAWLSIAFAWSVAFQMISVLLTTGMYQDALGHYNLSRLLPASRCCISSDSSSVSHLLSNCLISRPFAVSLSFLYQFWFPTPSPFVSVSVSGLFWNCSHLPSCQVAALNTTARDLYLLP